MTRRPRRGRLRVCVVTGTRAEYGILKTVLRAIDAHSRLDLQLLVTGTHLLRKFGHTVDGIRADGWRVDAQVAMQRGNDDTDGEAEAVGRGIEGIARAIRRLRSDIVLVAGDRIEAFAGAAAAAVSRRFVAHIHGGDRALGDVDDSLRHAITKLAHVHFAATPEAAARLKRMGEEATRVFCVGAPGLDDIRAGPRPTQAWLRRTLGWDAVPPYALVAQHPCGRAAALERRDMIETLAAVAAAGLAGVVIYPNSDPGHSGIVEAIEQREHIPNRWFVARSLPREVFIRLLKGAQVLVGNSSSGIIESATAGVAAVNIGPRQKGRQKCGPGVVDSACDRAAVLRAIRRAMKRDARTDNTPYGDGRSGQRIASVLARLPWDAGFRRKLIPY